jgi:hypothetical protein
VDCAEPCCQPSTVNSCTTCRRPGTRRQGDHHILERVTHQILHLPLVVARIPHHLRHLDLHPTGPHHQDARHRPVMQTRAVPVHRPLWPCLVLVALVVAGAGVVIAAVVTRVWRDAEPATWQVDPSFVSQATSTQILILVFERACSSGTPTTGWMQVDNGYTPTAMTIGIEVTPLGGDQDCIPIPTRYVVELGEALAAGNSSTPTPPHPDTGRGGVGRVVMGWGGVAAVP